ncbi:forkhead box protein P1-B-like isoform X1 [Kryptolebias marmoratus]|uniref:forkhead box protein P1-B-like isoform X1 n=1 Tax=Kryptolebias marmoratus TaxID=37003 RepID=UPI0007F882B1|nr:forkhead box protein P1-B-like isoform X1 [Kryptolebias marmoratus]
MEDIIRQKRPSVLRQVPQTSSRQQEDSAAVFICKEEEETGHLSPPSSLPMESAVRPRLHLLSMDRHHDGDASVEAGHHDGVGEGTNALFVSGLCCWPGCGAVLEDFSSFLKHLHSEHRHGDRSIGQWRVQQDIVQYMERQLVLEKQKLLAMQLHLSEHRYSEMKVTSDWPYRLPLLLPLSQLTNEDRLQPWSVTPVDELVQHDHTANGSDHLLPDLVPTIECYKYNNIRPPYTYAYLIRWSILESPDKQRTLNEIYNWFTTMFFYFRHNTATWKNAVRHNLSLHKCFVRVEGGKGAVWTVDEREYQRRKGQKYHRDCPLKWLTSYSHYCPKDP